MNQPYFIKHRILVKKIIIIKNMKQLLLVQLAGSTFLPNDVIEIRPSNNFDFQGSGFFYECENTAPNRANLTQIVEYLDVAKELVSDIGGKYGILGLADGMQIYGEGYNWKIRNEIDGDYNRSICYSVTKPAVEEDKLKTTNEDQHWYNTLYEYTIQPLINQISKL